MFVARCIENAVKLVNKRIKSGIIIQGIIIPEEADYTLIQHFKMSEIKLEQPTQWICLYGIPVYRREH